MLYDIDFHNVKTDIITLFDAKGNQRRVNILNKLKELEVNNKTITDCFSNKCLLNTYNKAKILINVHQTEHHHTFEELRVLPALLNGVIIISEDVPLKEKIPYSDFIIWCDYDKICEKTLEVSENYEKYYNEIFTNHKLKTILNDMKTNNLESFNNVK